MTGLDSHMTPPGAMNPALCYRCEAAIFANERTIQYNVMTHTEQAKLAETFPPGDYECALTVNGEDAGLIPFRVEPAGDIIQEG